MAVVTEELNCSFYLTLIFILTAACPHGYYLGHRSFRLWERKLVKSSDLLTSTKVNRQATVLGYSLPV